jgi:MFS family permease
MRSFLPQLGQPVWVLLSGVLFTHLGRYMLLLYFPIVLARDKGLPLHEVGFVLGAGSIAYLTSSLLGGWLSDRIGRRRTMLAGLVLSGFGLLGFIWVDSFSLLLATNLVAGFGNGLYMPSAKAGIAALVSQDTQTTAFSYRGIAASIGSAIGPLLGLFLHRHSVAALFAGAAAVYFALALEHWFLLERDCIGTECGEVQKGGFREIFTDRPFLLFSLVTIIVWALFTQFTFSLPLRAEQIHSARNIGLISTTSAIIVILLQGPTTRYVTRRLHPLLAMSLGIALIGVALGSVAFSTAFWHLIASAVLFTLGQLLVMPTSDAIVSDLSRPGQIGNYFGVSAFVYGAGEALGNMAGGQLMEKAVARNMLAMPWIAYAVIGLLVAGTYYALSLWRPLAQPLRPALLERTRNATFLAPATEPEDKPRGNGRRKSKT